MSKVRRITPESGDLECPMRYFIYTFYGLVRESKSGDFDYNKLAASLVDSYGWTYRYVQDVVDNALQQGLISITRIGNKRCESLYASL